MRQESFPCQIIQSLSLIHGFWNSWIVSLIPSVYQGVYSLLEADRIGKADHSWEWIIDGSWSNSVLFLKDNCWTWVIYGINDSGMRDELQKLGSLMVYLISHICLESALISDCRYPEPSITRKWFKTLGAKRASEPLSWSLDETCLGIQEALVAFENMMLSTSIGSKFPPPFLLVKLSELEKEEENQQFVFSLFLKRATQNFFWMKSKPRMSLISVESKTGLKYITMDPDQYSTFVKHQCIACSVSVESPNNDIDCVLPVTVTIQYYKTDNEYSDYTMLGFFQDLFKKAKTACQDGSCTDLFYQHILNYSHYKYNIAISIELDDESRSIEGVYSWDKCVKCNYCTEKSEMSRQSLLYSFGKYLELLLYSKTFFPKLACNHSDDSGLSINRRFGFKNLIISFTKREIQLSQVCISKIQFNENRLQSIDDEASKYTLKIVEKLSETVIRFYDCILLCIEEMISTFKNSDSEKIMMMLEDMKIVFLEEEKSLLETLKIMEFSNINDIRLMISNILSRDRESFESWLKEFAPNSQYLVKLDSLDFTGVNEIICGHSIVLRIEEPASLISFTLLSPEYKSFLSGLSEKGTDEWNLKNEKYESKIIYLKNDSGEEHIKYSYRKDKISYSCTIYFAKEFQELRNAFGVATSFPFSLERCSPWKTQGGKSQVSFFKSSDDKYVIKQLASKWTIVEKDELLKFAPSYLKFIKENRDKPSILAKIFGFFNITHKDASSGNMVQMDLIVMENIFAKMPISKKFDLKGIPDRKLPKKERSPNSIGLDHEWVEGHYKTLFKLHGHSKHIIQESVENDLQFLSNSNVMDYSLLVGIHTDTQELIIGIVDFIGHYNWYKKIECKGKSTIKQTMGQSDESVTVLAPEKYAKRFRKAINQYFLAIPGSQLEHSVIDLTRTTIRATPQVKIIQKVSEHSSKFHKSASCIASFLGNHFFKSMPRRHYSPEQEIYRILHPKICYQTVKEAAKALRKLEVKNQAEHNNYSNSKSHLQIYYNDDLDCYQIGHC